MDSLHSSRVETRGGYSAEQLEAIRIFGRKDLTEGCIIHGNEYTNDHDISEEFSYVKFQKESDPGFSNQTYIISTEGKEYLLYSILGHIPHLEDLFRLAKEKKIAMQCFSGIGGIIPDHIVIISNGCNYNIPYNPTLPLLDQPNLSDILNLFK